MSNMTFNNLYYKRVSVIGARFYSVNSNMKIDSRHGEGMLCLLQADNYRLSHCEHRRFPIYLPRSPL